MAEIRLYLEQASGGLPDVCMRCGQEATVSKSKNMSWFPPWVNVLILAGLLPYAIVAMILTKRATVKAPFCDQHKGHWLNRNLLIWGTLILFAVIGVGSLVVAANLPRNVQDNVMPFVCISCVVLLVVWVIILIAAQNTAIRAKEITEDEILLQGVCDEFVDAVEDAERARRARRKKRLSRWEDDEVEEEEEPRPRKSERSEHVREDRPAKKKPPIEDDEDEPKPRKKKPRSDEIEE